MISLDIFISIDNGRWSFVERRESNIHTGWTKAVTSQTVVEEKKAVELLGNR